MAVTVTYARADVAGKFDFITNHATTGDQMMPDVLGLSNGGFVAAYLNSSSGATFMQLDFYDANYNYVVSRVPSEGSTQAAGQPSLTQLANGNVLVVWDEDSAFSPGLRAHLYSSTGASIGSELTLQTDSTTYADPQVAALADGGFAISYTFGSAVDFNRYDASGVFKNAATLSDTQNDVASESAVAALANGGFVVTYTSRDKGTGDSDINGVVYGPTSLAPDYYTLDTGSDTMTGFGVSLQTQSQVVGLPNGGFALVYTDSAYQEGGSLRDGITLQVRNNLFNKKLVHVNDTSSAEESNPDIAVLANGFILVTWTRPVSETDRDIFGRLFDLNGDAVTVGGISTEFIVTSSGTDDTLSAVSRLTGGKYIASWQDSSTDGSGGSIHSKISEFTRTVVGDSANDTFVGDQFRDTFTGGTGNDTFVYKPGGNADVWTDFAAGGGSVDRVDLSGFLNLKFSDVLAHATQSGNDTIIDFGGGDTLTLKDVVKNNLSADDFTGLASEHFNQITGQIRAFAPGPDGWSSNDKFPRELADVNGDGNADIVGFGGAGVYVSLATGTGSFGPIALKSHDFGSEAAAGGWASDDHFPRQLADINGDHIADIVGFGGAGAYVALGTSSGSFGTMVLGSHDFGTEPSAGGWINETKFPRELADINGDGKADIVGFGGNGVYVALATGNGSFGPIALASHDFGAEPAAGGWVNDDKFLRQLADVNGDGKADIVGFGGDGVYVALATGNGSFGAIKLASHDFGTEAAAGGWTSNDRFPRELADANGDGKVDIVGFGGAGMYIAFGNGDGSFKPIVADLQAFGFEAGGGGWTSEDRFPRHLADVNHDGAADIVGFGFDGVYEALSSGFHLT